MGQILKPIAIGGALCAVLDFTAATVLYAFRGVKPLRLWQSVASGMLGPSSYQHGWASGALGLLVHVLVAFTASAVFFVVSSQLPALRRHYLVAGVLYGVAIYLFMNLVVIPLSAIPRRNAPIEMVIAQVLIHIILIGPSISFSVSRFSR